MTDAPSAQPWNPQSGGSICAALRGFAWVGCKHQPDRYYKTSEFLEQGITVANQYNLADLVITTGVKFKPGDLVFQEAASTLYDARNRKFTRGTDAFGARGWKARGAMREPVGRVPAPS